MKRIVIVVVIIAFSLFPVKAKEYNHQELNLNFSDEMTGQPIDIKVKFDKPCYALNEHKHSIKLLYNGEEIESQIYNIKFKNNNEVESCNIVFIYRGKGEYIIEYGEEMREVNYKDHVEVKDIYYYVEPISGYYAKVNCYEIRQDGESIFGICQKGIILGIDMGNKVISMKEGAKRFEMKNWNQIFSFAFFFSNGEEKGSDEKLIGKKILVDGNLMARVAVETSSRDGNLRTKAIYTYYYSPDEKRLFVKILHESNENWEGNATYAYFSSVHSTSKSIEELNMGYIPPYIHLNGENGVEEYKFNTNPESKEFQWIITSKDGVHLGNPPWVSLDDKKKAYALIFSTPSLLVTAATKEEINIPGLEVDGGGVNVGEYGKVGSGKVYEGIIEVFMGECRNVKREAEVFNKLIPMRNFEGEEGEIKKEKTHNLSVVLGLRRSLPFSSYISALLGIKIPHMYVEVWKNGSIVSGGVVNFRKIKFELPEGDYMVKVFHEGIKKRCFVGSKYISLREDERVKVWCTLEGVMKIDVNKGSIVRILDGGILTENVSKGECIIKLPAMKKYSIEIFYHGFLMEKEEVFMPLFLKKSYSFKTYNFSLILKDTLGLNFGANATVLMRSDEMVEKENIEGEKKGDAYEFHNLPSASYEVVVNYKGFSKSERVEIPSEKIKKMVIPVEYSVEVKTYDSRGFPTNTEIVFEREGKEFERNALPPGKYNIKVYDGKRMVGQREIFLNGDAKYKMVIRKTSLYPYLLPSIALIALIFIRRREAFLGFLLSLSAIFPWWEIKGATISTLYIFPPVMIEMGGGYGDILSLPSPLPLALYSILVFLLLSMAIFFIKNYSKFSIAPLLISLSIFLYTIYRFSSITVGGVMGKGVLEGENATWGFGIGFYFALLSLILISIKVIHDEIGRSS